jgi:hypothetical protein
MACFSIQNTICLLNERVEYRFLHGFAHHRQQWLSIRKRNIVLSMIYAGFVWHENSLFYGKDILSVVNLNVFDRFIEYNY